MRKQAGLSMGFCCALALAALTLGTGLRPVAAADFPLGAYSAAGFTVTFAGKGQFTVKKARRCSSKASTRSRASNSA